MIFYLTLPTKNKIKTENLIYPYTNVLVYNINKKMGVKKMEKEKILEIVWQALNNWNDNQIGTFVRRALTEDITEEDLLKEMGVDKAWWAKGE